MTLAPRVQVYTQLSCNAVYGHDVYNHTLTLTAPADTLSPLAINGFPPRALQQSVYSPDSASPSSAMVTFQDDDDDEPDPRSAPSERCLKDPAVQAGAARIQMMMTVTMGTLSALTTGWWGTFGDTHGRTRVLAISTFGLFLTFVVPMRKPVCSCSRGSINFTGT